ncbi:MAG: hypothetical protein RMH84_01930 [Sulfolobales archaeon]|nr:hypothetical protein [Sulfolobales archaeon]MCX8208085.1 hypothetical protein [Sulfolobales archaeon]MDW8010338.1 hypothetical protein [Sulfolobales archaeon]
MEYLSRLIEALHLAVYSYIKPAAPHRYSTRFRDLESIVFTVSSSLDVYSQAFTAGLDVGTGKETLYSVGIGRLFYNSLAKSYRKLGARAHQTLSLALIPFTLSVAYSLKQQSFASSFRKIFFTILGIDNSKDTSALVDGIRQFYGAGYTALLESGITFSKLATEKPSIGDILSALSSKARDIQYVLKRMDYIVEVGLEVGRVATESIELNDIAVRAFLKLARFECEKLSSVAELNQRVLYELDRELLREGVDLSYLITPLILTLILSNYLGRE